MHNIVSQCVHEFYLRTTLSSSLSFPYFYYLLGSAWLVKHFVTPAIKAEWMLYKKMCMFMQEITERIFPPFLFVSTSHVCEPRINEVWDLDMYVCFEFALMDWYSKPVEFGCVDMGRREWASKTQLPARCTMLFVRGVYLDGTRWHFPLDVFKTCTNRPFLVLLSGIVCGESWIRN